ncbi:hypothetical protein J5N97_013499 [Dioscorea zingiberensis]|uniref:Calmodulin-binding domain-containing protein n=1 Tax=Dioscorea zingiberensis TaxID=325984 RepID=A0A9D5CTF2_9LILI|nr:hypothetical protein J5N97_013499 [Dioscorea zingiberensis]
MVQKKAKAPIKLSSQTSVAAARKALVQPEKSFFASHHLNRQDTKRKGGGEIKKKMGIRRRGAIQQVDDDLKTLPNYMKPTSSSGARKEQLKLSATSPSSCSGSKPAKILVIKSCLKLVRVPSIKKNQGSGCCNQKKTVNRATCSSTQKDNKFPKALDLNPGGTEAEGTSVKKVCPYNYCSLNGHRHDEPLPPLKSFLSAIRQSFKTEQRMKSKKKEMDTGQKVTGLKIQPLVEEFGDDFFVEIYAKEQQRKVELVSCDQNCVQDDKKEVVDEIHELERKVVSTDNDIDDSSELSVDEMDGMMNLIEFIECGQVVKDDEEQNQPLTKSKDVAGCSLGCCCIEHLRGNDTTSEGFTENEFKCVISEAIHINLEEETSVGAGKYDDDKLGIFHYPSQEIEDVIDSLSADADDAFITSEIARVAHEVYEDVPDQKGESFSFHEDLEDNEEERQVCDVIESSNENKLDAANNLIQGRLEHAGESSEDQCDNLIVVEEEVSKSDEFSDQGSEDLVEQSVVKHEEERIASELLDQNMVVKGIQEVEDTNTSGSVKKVSLTHEQFSESYESTTDSDEECFEASDDDETDEEDEICLKDCAQRTEENKISSYTARITRAHSLTESSDNPKIRIRITRKERWEEAEMMREFNPRSPKFLPCNPDPDSEKVDLRHQMIDERKNAEEWMIDYALRQAVTKLSPARKRKVALLVEAFEKVVPLTIQACS